MAGRSQHTHSRAQKSLQGLLGAGRGADGELALLDRRDKLRGAVIEHLAGALDRARADVEHRGGVVLSNRSASWRSLVGPLAVPEIRNPGPNHRPLAFVQVPALADSVAAGTTPLSEAYEAALARVTKAANETHADCLRIIIRAETRRANEIDHGQEAGEIAEPGGDRFSIARTSGNAPGFGDIGVESQRVSEWRTIRDAEEGMAIRQHLAPARARSLKFSCLDIEAVAASGFGRALSPARGGSGDGRGWSRESSRRNIGFRIG